MLDIYIYISPGPGNEWGSILASTCVIINVVLSSKDTVTL